jgi:glycosyltransferase involved in cell wall biosynthesis
MRILYFHQHFTTPRGASGTRSYEFARALVARGHSVVMVCGNNQIAKLGLDIPTTTGTNDTAAATSDSATDSDSEKKRQTACKTIRGAIRGTVDGIEVIALPVGYSNRDSIPRRLLAFAKFALQSVSVALREPCDIIFATSTPLTAAIPGIFAKILRRKPFVFEVRDLWPELPRAMGMRNPFLLMAMSLLEWAGYHAADALLGLSPGIVRGIRKRAPQKTPVEMIPNGCDLELFKPQNTAESDSAFSFSQLSPALGDNDFVAGFTGAHGLANGLESVLAAARVLKQRGAARVKFLFIGDGNRKDALVAQAEAEGLDNCVFLPPMPKTDLARVTARLGCGLMVLKNASAFYYGTSPNKFFDYIAAGLPVLNNYPGWLADMIHENACGLAVSPDSPEAFADALETLAASPDNNAKMRLAARALAEREFSRDKLASDFCNFLEKTKK